MNLKNIVPALALLLCAGVSSANESAFLQAAANAASVIKVNEGFSGVGSAKRANLSPIDSWNTISKRAHPSFPGVRMPDGKDYPVSMLCAEANNLRVVKPTHGYVCKHENTESGNCVFTEKIALVTSRDYVKRSCRKWELVNIDAPRNTADSQWVNQCTGGYKTKARRYPLDYKVGVYSKGETHAESGRVIIPSVLLFEKPFTIPGC